MSGKPRAKQAEVRTIAAGEFKAKCLQLLDEVRDSQISVVITKRGVPWATVRTERRDTRG